MKTELQTIPCRKIRAATPKERRPRKLPHGKSDHMMGN